MVRIQIQLTEQDFRRLRVISDKEYRDPRQQAGILIREALEMRSLLEDLVMPTLIEKPAELNIQGINHE